MLPFDTFPDALQRIFYFFFILCALDFLFRIVSGFTAFCRQSAIKRNKCALRVRLCMRKRNIFRTMTAIGSLGMGHVAGMTLKRSKMEAREGVKGR